MGSQGKPAGGVEIEGVGLPVPCEKPETIPRPAARIQKFKEFLDLRTKPVVRRVVQPPVCTPFSL